MKATIPYVEKKFEEFNRLMFDGRLPMLPIELSDAKTFLGVCVYKKRRTLLGKTVCYDFKLRINTRIDLDEAEVEDIIIHEMIHYNIGYHRIVDTSAHGRVFRQMMKGINERFGRHIRVSHKPTAEQKEQLYGDKRRWHMVAFVVFKDGRTGIKVLPRIAEKVVNYYNWWAGRAASRASSCIGRTMFSSTGIPTHRLCGCTILTGRRPRGIWLRRNDGYVMARGFSRNRPRWPFTRYSTPRLYWRIGERCIYRGVHRCIISGRLRCLR